MHEATIQIGDVKFSVPKAVIARALFGEDGPLPQGHALAPQDPSGHKIGDLVDGGIYAGLTLSNNQPCKLFLLPGDEEHDWKSAMAWADKQSAVLPARIDALILFQNLRDQFKREAYWTSEPSADYSAYAWFQSFGSGFQVLWHKDRKHRVRLVRRVPI